MHELLKKVRVAQADRWLSEDFHGLDMDAQFVPTLAFLERNFKKVKLGRGFGEDVIPGEVYHYVPKQLARVFLPVMMKAALRVEEPLAWRGGTMRELLKSNGKASQCAAYRAILVSDEAGKSFHRHERQQLLEPMAEFAVETQLGGMPNMGADFGVMLMNLGSQWAVARGLSCGKLFVDAVKERLCGGRANVHPSGGCKEMILKPRTALMTRAYAMMTGVYAATYLAANTIDTVATRQRYSQKTHVAATLIGTTAVNASACIAKDVAFAKMYGGSGAGKKAMPFASYGLFLSRDLITIFSSFTLPKMLAKGMSSSGAMDPVSAQACAQMVSPVAMQGVCAPVHLLALNMYLSLIHI
mgnify:CR=1 FL=1